LALHTQLEIYKAAYGLLNVAVDYVVNMPRPVKAVIGGRIRDLCLNLVVLIASANAAHDKVPFLDELLRDLKQLEILLRICQDKRYISKGQYAQAVELSTSVGKQATGWRRYFAASPVT